MPSPRFPSGEDNPMYGRKGDKHPWYGKHHSEEAKRKISNALKGIKRPYFSEYCKKRAKEGLTRGEKNPNWRGGEYKKCEVCGKRFWVIPSRTSTARFCSVRCKAKSQLGDARKRNCEGCGKVFRVVPSDFNTARFCSKKCYSKWLSENMDGKNNPFYGKHHTKETREKWSRNRKGRKLSEEWRKKLAESHRGETRSEETRKRMSRAIKQWMQKHGPTYPKLYYAEKLGHSVRSKWEEEIGLLFKANNITYGYEAKTFKFNGTSYTPDFIVGYNVIEVKGPLYDSQRKKYREFNDLHPELNFIMVGNGSDEICDIHIPWKERERLVGVLSG